MPISHFNIPYSIPPTDRLYTGMKGLSPFLPSYLSTYLSIHIYPISQSSERGREGGRLSIQLRASGFGTYIPTQPSLLAGREEEEVRWLSTVIPLRKHSRVCMPAYRAVPASPPPPPPPHPPFPHFQQVGTCRYDTV